jgi:hypothetical protein
MPAYVPFNFDKAVTQSILKAPKEILRAPEICVPPNIPTQKRAKSSNQDEERVDGFNPLY